MRAAFFTVMLFVGLASCSKTRATSDPQSTEQEAGKDTAFETGADAIPDNVAPDAMPDYLWKEGDCVHPKVEKQCEHGWCRIPAGCFIIGSPEDEFARAKYDENQTPVTLTRTFHMSQNEITQAQWTSLGLPNPTVEGSADGCRGCFEPDCPLTNMTWFETLAFANVASEKHDPPLQPCYKLLGCKGKLGEGMVCEGLELTAPTVYDCEGFRLPTEAEWEYAARAGTREANYNGGFGPHTTLEDARRCGGEPSFDPISWNCSNADNWLHPVGGKMPNQWGLHDMLGNGQEFVFDVDNNNGYGDKPLTDPSGTFVAHRSRGSRGGACTGWPTTLRVAAHMGLRWDEAWPGTVIRLVRTGADNPGRLGP